jgi:hypothetical protein
MRNHRYGRIILLAGLTVAGCGGTGTGGGVDQAGAVPDAAGDLATVAPPDLVSADLVGYSDLGGPCGGNTSMPKQCLPGLVCVLNRIPDTGGTCEYPDAGACQPNSAACTKNSDCCSNNCILRGSPGFCCEPGGCP